MADRAYLYRLYPTAAQRDWILRNIGCCRFVYNQALAWRRAAYDADGTRIDYKDTAYGTARSKRMYPWLKEADSASLQQSLRHLDAAYRNFFRGNAGFPKFKSRRRSRQSYTTPMNGNSIRIGDGSVSLPKVGTVRAAIHRRAPEGWAIKSATVSLDAGGSCYCSVLYEYTEAAASIDGDPCENAVGIDYISDGLGYLSTGEVLGSPKQTQANAKKLARAQRKLSRRTGARKGEVPSKNFLKQQRRVGKIHRKIANTRKDDLHKKSASIAKRFGLVGVEDLNMRSLSDRSFGNGKATLDNGYGMFLAFLEYKLRDRGKYLVRIDKWYPSSQLCYDCGHRNREVKDLRIRRWACPACGTVHDRDANAAMNIRDEAVRIFKEQEAV